MEELEIVLECETNKEQEINLINEGTVIYPQLEDIEITPSTTDKIYKSENYYGYNEITVKGTEGVAEDLTTELTDQDNLITTQEVSIEDITEALKGKMAGGNSVIPKVEENTLIFSTGIVEGGVLSI